MKNALLLAFALTVFGCKRPPPPGEGTAPGTQTGNARQEEGAGAGTEACVDRWLSERQLDPYGHPEGTMYTGGTPLFDERTGETTERLAYVFARHPEAQQACAPGTPPPPPAMPER